MITNYTFTLFLVGVFFISIYLYSLIINRLLMSANYRIYEHGSPLFFIFLAPGVVVHEVSHALMCKLLGVEIYEFKPLTFERRGFVAVYGYVKRESTGNPIKEALISTAPLYISIIVLSAIVILFLGIGFGKYILEKFRYLLEISGKDAGLDPFEISSEIIFATVYSWISSGFLSPVFWIIPYLSMTILLSIRPSTQDLEIAFRGLIYLLLGYIILIIVSIPMPQIRFLFYGFFEFLLSMLSLVIALALIGTIFLAIIYQTFRTGGIVKVFPFIIAIALAIILEKNLGNPATTIISLATLLATQWITKTITQE